MANAVWVVSKDIDDDNRPVAVFKTRQAMLTSLEEKYPGIKIDYRNGKPEYATGWYLNGDTKFFVWFSLDRFKLDDWRSS